MTQVFNNYFVKALHDAKIDDLAANYSRNGYEVQRNVKTSHGEFDLVVNNKQQKRTIAFEVKLAPITKDAQKTVERLRQEAADLGYEFRFVTIARPVRPSIDIDWLDTALLEYLIENTIPELDEIATHVQYENIEVSVDAIRVSDDSAKTIVHGDLDVELQYGSSSDVVKDIGFVTSFSVPFDGELDLDMSSQKVSNAKLRIDLSDWVGSGDE